MSVIILIFVVFG